MRLFGLNTTREKAAVAPLSRVDMRGWFGVIREGFAGAFQSHVELDPPQELASYSGLYAPLTLVAGDVAKLRVKLMRNIKSIWEEVTENSPFLKVLRKPNHFQTRIQFVEMWVLCKLMHGNVYVLKERDARGVVVALYILDPSRVTPLVTPSGDVYYRLSADNLAGVGATMTVAARDIIHDRMNCLFHPLVGVAPVYAAAMSATQGRKIQNNSASFFENMSRPGGMLTAPATIDDETARRLKTEFEINFSGSKLGRLFVAGDSLEFKPMAIPADQAQLIEQLDWTVKDIARALLVPEFMVGGSVPSNSNIEAETLRYYSQCLQKIIEQLELCLDEGLELPADLRTEADLDGLIRMDSTAQAQAIGELVKAGVLAPNEGRARINLPPVVGGDSPYLQQQHFSLRALHERDQDKPFTKPTAAPSGAPATPAEPVEDKAAEVTFWREVAMLPSYAADAVKELPPLIVEEEPA